MTVKLRAQIRTFLLPESLLKLENLILFFGSY